MPNPRVLRVAIIGCGKIADQHVEAIRRIPDAAIVATCDQELLMAMQLAERFDVSDCFSSSSEMLQKTAPDVVHITTPPQSHFSLASECLSMGSHVYVEKPFTVTGTEAERLINLAESTGLKLTAGHNYQFTLEMIEMRRLVSQGFLGGPPVHLESHLPYDLSDRAYAAALLGSATHWVRKLPGRLLHNIISHGIARLAEFLADDLDEVVATGFQSQQLKSLGGGDVFDELRVLIRDKTGTTAFFSFSSQVKPGLNSLRVCGPRNSLIVDYVSGSVIQCKGRRFKSYLTYLARPFTQACQHVNNGFRNINAFARCKLYQDFGMTELIARLYESIRLHDNPPIPYREILLTSRIMDEIFSQIYPAKPAGYTETPATLERAAI